MYFFLILQLIHLELGVCSLRIGSHLETVNLRLSGVS